MKTLLIGTSLALAVTAGPVLAQDCTPSKYGPADEIGAANLVTPERVLAASKLIKHGKSHPLGIVVVPGMPAYPPRSVPSGGPAEHAVWQIRQRDVRLGPRWQ